MINNKIDVKHPTWLCPETYDNAAEAYERKKELIRLGANPDDVVVEKHDPSSSSITTIGNIAYPVGKRGL